MKAPTNDIIRRMRLPLIILVTYAHSYGGVAEGYSLLGSGWDTYEVLKIAVSQTLVKVAVPTFFVISGYLFFANVDVSAPRLSWGVYWQKMRRRAKTLLLPYIVWNVLMGFKLWGFSGGHSLPEWLSANMPLWFLRDLMAMSLLTPLLYIAIRRLGLWFIAPLTLFYLAGIIDSVPGPSMYAPCFFTLGAYLSIRRMDLVETCLRYRTPAFILTAVFGLAMVLTYHYSPLFPTLLLCFRLVSVGAVVSLFSLRSHPNRSSRYSWALPVSSAAYFIYLAHYVFFMSPIDDAFFTLFGPSTASLCLHYLLCPLLKAAVLVAIYMPYFYTINRGIRTTRP